MKKLMSLAEVKEFFENEKCFETETCFLINEFGKYNPNICFVVDKEFDLNEYGGPMNPLEYFEDYEVTANMNIDFNGAASFMFGDFWISKCGEACFRPKDAMEAKHILIKVSWGGSYNRTRGNEASEVNKIKDVLYFRHAVSNGGGEGYDFWIVPVGFRYIIHDDEFDGASSRIQAVELKNTETPEYCQKISSRKQENLDRADKNIEDRKKAVEKSRLDKFFYEEELIKIQRALKKLAKPQKWSSYQVDQLKLDDFFFTLGYMQYLYTSENISFVKGYLAKKEEYIRDAEKERQAKYDARLKYTPKFQELEAELGELGWTILCDDQVYVKNPNKEISGCLGYECEVLSYEYSKTGLKALRHDMVTEADRQAVEKTKEVNSKRIRRLLAKTDLPQKLWFLFEGTEAIDSAILDEVQAILNASYAPKNEVDLHELINCSFKSKTEASRRVIERAGGGKVHLKIEGAANCRKLANFLVGK